MSLIPLAVILVKIGLVLGPLFFGIRCLFVHDHRKDSFVYDTRWLFSRKFVRKRKNWVVLGTVCIVAGLSLSFPLFIVGKNETKAEQQTAERVHAKSSEVRDVTKVEESKGVSGTLVPLLEN